MSTDPYPIPDQVPDQVPDAVPDTGAGPVPDQISGLVADQIPDQVRAQIAAVLAELPDLGADLDAGADVAEVDIDAVAGRLEWAHDQLVRALESVEQG